MFASPTLMTMVSTSDKPKEEAPAPRPGRGTNRLRTFCNGLAVGVVLTGSAGWYFIQQAKKHPQAQQKFQQASTEAADAAAEAIFQTSVALKSKLETLDLKPAQVQEELARTGKTVRRRAREFAGQVADATADTRLTAAI